VNPTQLRKYRSILKLIFLSVFGLIIFLSVPAFSLQQIEKTSKTIVQPSNVRLLLQQGIEHYETERFSEALTVWQKANAVFATQKDRLSQALVQCYFSLAYQHLGEWEKAETSIAQSLNLLQNLEKIADQKAYSEILAKALNAKGSLLWSKGQLEEAKETWEAAALNYLRAGNESGVLMSKINQAQAIQALGLNRRAQNLLQQVYQNLQQQPDSELKARGLQNLGKSLRRVGNLKGSQEVLQESLKLAAFPTVKSSTMLELGNTERAIGDRAIAIGKIEEAQQHTQAALEFYRQAATIADADGLQPQLNQLSLLIETGQWLQAAKLESAIAPKLSSLPPSRTAIYNRLNFAWSLTCLKQIIDKNNLSCINDARREQLEKEDLTQTQRPKLPSWQEIARILATSVQQARNLKDPLAQSHALGQLGRLYELLQQRTQAQDLTQKALLSLEKIQAPEIRYRWEWQLGRLLKQQGDLQDAIAAYTGSVETLKSLRNDLLAVNADVQFSFRDNVEPVYRELVDLLLKPTGNAQLSQANLEKAIAAIDALQLAELENFLGCNLSRTTQLNQALEQIDPKAAFIYPIILPHQLEVIFKLPGQPLKHYTHAVEQTVVETTLQELRKAIVRRNVGLVREKSQKVYQWLLEPLEESLEKNPEVETLVFVLDGYLRNIPMAILYDNKTDRYLVEKKYALALLPSARLFDLRSRKGQLQVLGAGISKELTVGNRHFEAIDATEELNQIEKVLSSKILLNSQFTQANLHKYLKSGDFSLVHLATHGNFSSEPEETFILAYNTEKASGELLKPNDLNNLLLNSSQETVNPIELLVLSACQTASGDNRAILGLAGLAVRSGARSTLATLWQVNDKSSIKFMGQFYQALSQPGVTKAQALHLAQQALLKNPDYQNPYDWGAYVLIGNWL
jgi:CHAT domain-containing protein